MDDKFLKPYNSQDTESRIYKMWEESGYFNPDVCMAKGVTLPDTESFSIVLPPPNVTGRLHLGHALEHSIQDTAVRYARMRGKKTLWIPGTDHAAIATQSRFEKEHYAKDKKSRHDYPRDEYFNMIHEFGIKNQKDMEQQMRLMGSSLDWSREAFTLDDRRSLAVRTAFKTMYDAGLIYRGNRIINWDPKGQTTIADDEIVYETRKSKLYTFKYSKDFPIPIATTRLETKIGDTAVAVHPEDERYIKYVGQTFEISDFCGVPLSIKVIADKSVDKDFGTGALGVTPSHSMIDWEIADRHGLDRKQVINEYAKITAGDDRLIGKKTTDAREVIAEWLKGEGLLLKEEEIEQNVSTAERTGGIVEPLPKLQWFIDVNKPIDTHGGKSLKELMREPVADKQIDIFPDHFEKIYFNWIENLHDWCISRQIIYGHRIPVWYRNDEIYCDIEAPQDNSWSQDPDTLDTWFSSALWTFSTLGWPDKTKDLDTYHPTTLMNPGYEILFFWVARMTMMSMYHLKSIPFKTVYIHGIVRDKSGKKFSKSNKNGIEPEEIISKYGTDALRMSMLVGNGPGADLNFDEQKIKGYKNFANKLWNIARFILSSCVDMKFDPNFEHTEADKKLSEEQCAFVKEITKEMDEYKFHLVSEKIYHFAWHTLADVILEESKKIFASEDDLAIASRKNYLLGTLEGLLITLHPFMPFVTEEIWQTWKKDESILMIEKWPIV